MQINNLPTDHSELRALLQEQVSYYYKAVKNRAESDKITAIQENIKQLRALVSNRRNRKNF